MKHLFLALLLAAAAMPALADDLCPAEQACLNDDLFTVRVSYWHEGEWKGCLPLRQLMSRMPALPAVDIPSLGGKPDRLPDGGRASLSVP